MFCTNCANVLKTSDKFCTECGQVTDIHIDQPPIIDKTVSIHDQMTMGERTMPMHDYSMHETIGERPVFPSSPIATPAQPPPIYMKPLPASPAKKKSKIRVLLFILIPILIAGSGVGGFFLGRMLPSDTDEASDTAQVIPTDPTYPPPTEAPSTEETPTDDPPTEEPPTEEPPPTDPPPTDPPPTEPPLNLPPFPGRLDRSMSARSLSSVRRLQIAINDISAFYTSVRRITLVNGHFGGNTAAAVFEFQNRTGLPRTGVVDEATWYLIMERQARSPLTSDSPYVPQINTEYVVMSPLNFRRGPSLGHSVMTTFPIGSIVFATHYMGNGWLRVTSGNHTGYMYRQFLLLRSIHE